VTNETARKESIYQQCSLIISIIISIIVSWKFVSLLLKAASERTLRDTFI